MTRERLDDVRSRHREDALQRGINPRDVDLLLSDLLARPLSWLIAHGEEVVDVAAIESLLARRYAGEPLQYIRKRTEFYSREFYVDDRVLIPRPETELLVEAALERAPRNGRVVDIGSGSGCIAITIERERRAVELLQWFGLGDWIDARIENLSHGMKQKLVIVSALVHDPAVLVIDEPMVGLDALAQRQVKQLFRRLANQGKTVFLTTHTLSVAEAVCDRIAIINRGRIVATGTTAELKKESALEDVFLELTYDAEAVSS